MNSKERLLTAIDCGLPDRVPLEFGEFGFVPPEHLRWRDEFERVERWNSLGVDAILVVFAPWSMHPEVRVRSWREEPCSREPYPLLHKDYDTPAGVMTQIVRKADEDLGPGWRRQPDEIQLISDFNVPRYVKPAITDPEDLPKLRFILCEPTAQEKTKFQAYMKLVRDFADAHGTLIVGWGPSGMDDAIRLCGVEEAIFAAVDRPDYFHELLDIIHDWDKRKCEILLDEGVDLVIRRAWYDTTDFWSPGLYRRFIQPHLTELVEMTHAADRKLAYAMTSGIMPVLDVFKEIGFDLLFHVDPVQGEVDLRIVKEKLGGHIALHGGLNSAVTMGRGSRDEIRREVFEAVEILAPGGGFILSPGPLFPDTPWESVQTVIEAWKEVCTYDSRQ